MGAAVTRVCGGVARGVSGRVPRGLTLMKSLMFPAGRGDRWEAATPVVRAESAQ